jgi:hypothetical protein
MRLTSIDISPFTGTHCRPEQRACRWYFRKLTDIIHHFMRELMFKVSLPERQDRCRPVPRSALPADAYPSAPVASGPVLASLTSSICSIRSTSPISSGNTKSPLRVSFTRRGL